MRILSRALLAAAIVVLASSTISDPLQHLIEEGQIDVVRLQGPQDFSSFVQLERVALLRRIAGNADAVRELPLDDLTLLFGEPSLKRQEPEVVSWHFTSSECALDVYFRRRSDGSTRQRPIYAEYRVRGDARESGLTQAAPLDHKSCVRSLYAQAKTIEKQTQTRIPPGNEKQSAS